MKLASVVKEYLVKRQYIREDDLLSLLQAHASAFAPAIMEDMITSGFLSSISIDAHTIFVLGTARVTIRRDGTHAATNA